MNKEQNKRINAALAEWGIDTCVQAYILNVKRGEGGTVIEIETKIPKRSQGAAIDAGKTIYDKRFQKQQTMKTKHSPGPWAVAGQHPWIIEADSNLEGVRAEICKSSYQPNARLIAAAPELLEALAEMVHQQTEGPYFHEDEHTPLCPINKARAAIAKATA